MLFGAKYISVFWSMKNIALFFLAFLCTLSIVAQNKYDKNFYLIDIDNSFVFEKSDQHDVDSILRLYHACKADSTRLYYVRLFSEGLSNEYLWTRYNHLLVEMSKEKSDSLHQFYYGCALNNLGYESQFIKNDLKTAKRYYHEAYDVFTKIKNGAGLGVEINNLAYIYRHEGELLKAVELYTEAARLFEEFKQPLGQVSICVNLGEIYFNLSEYDKAEEFFKKALPLALTLEQRPVLANVYNQIALIENQKKQYHKAIENYAKALDLYKLEHLNSRVAQVHIGLANVYQNLRQQKDYEAEMLKAESAVKLTNDLQAKSDIYDHVALMYIGKKEFDKALPYADSAYKFGAELGYKNLMAGSAESLSRIYAHKNNFEKAFQFLRTCKTLEDSLENDATRKAAVKSQFQLEYNKKDIEMKAQEQQKDALRAAEKKQQQTVLVLVLIALAIISIFAGIAFRNYKVTKKQNDIIQAQKQEVIQKNLEVTWQKTLVEEKQREIIDSINYAKRIQTAVLTGKEIWKNVGSDYFIFFRPKDIVSGDFYWAYNIDNNDSIIVLADCTGHGVPGAFMSMLGNSFLNEIIIENNITDPSRILDKLRSKIIAALDQQGGDLQRDGMDMAICRYNKKSRQLIYAGANNPVWVSTKNCVVELKPDKMPVGSYAGELVPFASQTMDLAEEDLVFLLTDGFADQFGGPMEKKFKYKPLRDLMHANRLKPLELQAQLLEQTLLDWAKGLEQVDDISIIGFKA